MKTTGIEIKITISKNAVDMLSELQEYIEELKDLIPDWNRVEADQIEEKIFLTYLKILESTQVH